MSAAAELVGKLRELEPLPGKLRSTADEVADSWWCPDGLNAVVRSSGHWAADETQKAVDAVKPVIESVDYYTKQEKIPHGWEEIIDKISKEVLPVFDGSQGLDKGMSGYWEGHAADALTGLTKQHHAAASKLLEFANKGKDAVDASNKAFEDLYWSVIAASAAAIAVILPATIAISSAVGAAAGAAAAAGAIAAFLTVLAAAIQLFRNYHNTLADQARELRKALLLATEFPKDSSGKAGWPAPDTGSFDKDKQWTAK